MTMEALAAVGLASSVIQFVDFCLKIYGKTVEIAESAHGRSQLNDELKASCLRLEKFTSELNPAGSVVDPGDPSTFVAPGYLARRHEDTIRKHVSGINEIAAECNSVCHSLLAILKELRCDPSNRFRVFKSLAMAVKEHFKSKKIAQLEKKLKDYHSPLLLHMVALLNEHQKYATHLLGSVASMHHKAQFQQTERYDGLNVQLEAVSDNVKAIAERLRHQAARQEHPTHSDMEGLVSMLGSLQLSANDIGKAAKEQEIIRSLRFSEMKSRHENIAEAHAKTFEWVLQNRDDSHPASEHDLTSETEDGPEPTRSYKEGEFLRWLQSGSGVFWVTGKPGSGKSTLMKFIAGHKKTRAALKSWAGGIPLISASHYFWAIGTDTQKSQRGLLQKILFDILRQCPQLVWDIFPGRHGQQKSVTLPAASFDLPHSDGWSLKELHTALALLSEGTAVPARFCFFIDGLDEYSGDHFELCRTLQALSKSENLKCCVSSRPWNVFEDAFGTGGSAPLRMHDLTHDDIYTFAHERLEDIASAEHASVDESSIRELADIVTERAEGVFLWVFLVVEGLRGEISNSSTMVELSKVIKSLPNELEEYFLHALNKASKLHHRYMAKTFQLALSSRKALHLRIYQFYEYKEGNPDFALSEPTHDRLLSEAHIRKESTLCKRRINERCAGLLSFNKRNCVGFIHRTVHAFLMTGPMQEHLKSKIGTTFLPKVAILESTIFRFRREVAALAKFNIKKSLYPQKTCVAWNECQDHVNKAMMEDQEATFRLLDGVNDIQWIAKSPQHATEIQAALECHFSIFTTYLKAARTPSPVASESASATAGDDSSIVKLNLKTAFLKADFRSYITARLSVDANYFRADGISLLASVVRGSSYSKTSKRRNAELIIALLEGGQDPNEILVDDSQNTPWKILCSRFVRGYDVFSLMLAFLKHGADRTFLAHWVGEGKEDFPRQFLIHCIREASSISEVHLDPLRDAFAHLLDTTQQEKIPILEKMADISTDSRWSTGSRWNSTQGPLQDSLPGLAMGTDNETIFEIISLLTVEMVDAKIGKDVFLKWHSTWSCAPGLILAPAEEMAQDYLNSFKRKQPHDDNGHDEASFKRPRA